MASVDRIKRQVASLLERIMEPHGACSMLDSQVLRHIDFRVPRCVRMHFKPTRSHSPAFLLTLADLKVKVLEIRGVDHVVIEVVDVVDAERWTHAIEDHPS
ncbi:MAG TPA: hypothetical protein QF646_05425 [Candidatus Poseidoniales archaeon]|nr:hypothetical protein [Candidatus Poseidoniales archaeon]